MSDARFGARCWLAAAVLSLPPAAAWGALLPQTGWQVSYTSSEERVGEDGRAANAIDGDPATFWHTEWLGSEPRHPHELHIDLGSSHTLDGLRCLPRQDGQDNGRIGRYELYLSDDPAAWGSAVLSGRFADSASEQRVGFAARSGRYVRLVALDEVNGNPWASLAELRLTGTAGSGGGGSDGVLDRAAWSVYHVDSEEREGEDGSAGNALDGDPGSLWHTEWLHGSPPHPHDLQLDLGAAYELTALRYKGRTDGTSNGRIGRYDLYVSHSPDAWGSAVASGRFADSGAEQEVAFAAAVGRYVRLVARDEVNGNPWTSVAELDLVGSPVDGGNLPPDGRIDTPANAVTIAPGEVVNFAGSASDPEGDTPLSYRWDFGDPAIADVDREDPGAVAFPNAGTWNVTLSVTDARGAVDPTPARVQVEVRSPGGGDGTLDQGRFSLLYVDSEELIGEDGAAVNAFDGDAGSFWHTEWDRRDPVHPHEIRLDLGVTTTVSALRYLPRQDGSENGRIRDWELYVSSDSAAWGAPVATGRFANSAAEQRIALPATSGRYLRLVARNEVNGNPWTSVAELNVEGGCGEPTVRLTAPTARDLFTGTTLSAAASACLDPVRHAGWGVRFTLDGGSAQSDFSAPFSVRFDGVARAEHTVRAALVDAGGVEQGAADSVGPIGIGAYLVALGDSITDGEGDDRGDDDVSADGRDSGGGFPPVLNDRLSAARGYPHRVANAGSPGETAAQAVGRVDQVLAAHPDAGTYLILYGTNDSNTLLPVPSGLGLSPGDGGYPGSFKDSLQRLIDRITASGRQALPAKVPAVLDDAARNANIREFNQVIDELVAANGIAVTPPDLYTYFAAHPEQMSDDLHPDGDGYRAIADAWADALP